MKATNMIALTLVVIGALNWGLIGFFRLRFGDNPFPRRSVLGGKSDFCSGGAGRSVVPDAVS